MNQELELLLAKEAVRDLVQRSCWLLDGQRFDEWLEIFSPDGEYELVAYSPEIRSEMRWVKSTRESLREQFAVMPNHLCDIAIRSHLVTTMSIEVGGGSASALSRFVVFRTNPRGETDCYAVGHYEDSLAVADGAWRLVKRRAILETRMFEMFPHMIPL